MPYKEESKKARMCAIRYLVYRDRSRNEIIRHLKGKMFSIDVIDQTLNFLEEKDYINDLRFALKFGRTRIENKKEGRLRVEQELKSKGLESQVIRAVLNSLYEEYDEGEIAMICVKKKLQSPLSSDVKKERNRLVRFLERKGFAPSLAYQIVTQLVPL